MRSTALTVSNRQDNGVRAPPPPAAIAPDPASSSAAPPQPGTASAPPVARGPALQMRLLNALFQAHHEREADVSDRGFLAETGAAVMAGSGASGEEIRAGVLESEAWARAVDDLVAEVGCGRSMPIRAVPTLIVNDRYVIGGSQSAEFLADELERIRAGRGAGAGAGAAWGSGASFHGGMVLKGGMA